MDISVAFAPTLDTPAHVRLAEELGYRRAWCYDSPTYYADTWITLARAAERTSSIGLGAAVLVPSLRHVMVSAAAVATMAGLAPGRFAITLGSGFSGRMGLGHRAMRWSDVEAYVSALRRLLAGEEVDWDGRLIKMQHPARCAASRPVEVPIWIACDGPKGFAVANKLGDGAFFAPTPFVAEVEQLAEKGLLVFGTVLDDDETPTSPRAKAAFGPHLAAAYHIVYERLGADGVDALPGGRQWRMRTEEIPPQRRHLAIHEGHLVEINPRDQVIVDEGAANAPNLMWVDGVPGLTARIEAAAAEGVTEVVFQPAGPDIERELEAFARLITPALASAGQLSGTGR